MPYYSPWRSWYVPILANRSLRCQGTATARVNKPRLSLMDTTSNIFPASTISIRADDVQGTRGLPWEPAPSPEKRHRLNSSVAGIILTSVIKV